MKNYVPKEGLGLFDLPSRQQWLSEQGDPLERLKARVPWERFRGILEGALFDKEPQNLGGRPPYDPVLMFQVLVLQRYYNLSDEQTEYQINDRLSFQRFLGLGLGDRVPDARTIWLFREKLTHNGVVERVFSSFGQLLFEQGLIGKEGKIVDATFIEMPRQRNRREENKEIKKGKTPEAWQSEPHKLRHKDVEARWAKKGQETHYGYKDHVKVESRNKFIERYEVSAASVHDSQLAEKLIEEGDGAVWADSAYQSEEILNDLKKKKVENRIHEKGCRNRPLTKEQNKKNQEKSRVRARVEHVFGFLTNTMKGCFLRCVGLLRARAQIGLMNLVYNLARYEWVQRRESAAAA